MAFLNEYEILQLLGEGAFASVYKVRNNQLGYIRAIRVLKESIANEQDEKYQKFLKECQLLLRLGNGGHPNIVRITQPRLLQNHALVEMEYIQGQDVNDYLAQNNHFLPINEVLRFVQDISSALAYCHVDVYKFCMDREIDQLEEDPNDGSQLLLDDATLKRLIEKYKVIHNDIHSRNIIRKYDGSYILLDFGLAIQDGTVVKSSTRRGGAPEYKAPEKWDNEGIVSEQSDIYSLGILMYEMLAGQTPFPYDTKISSTRAEFELMEKHEKAIPPAIEPLRRAAFEEANPEQTYTKDYPDWLEMVIMKCLEKAPEKRYANGADLSKEVLENLTKKESHIENKTQDTAVIIEQKNAPQQHYDHIKDSKEEIAEKEKTPNNLKKIINYSFILFYALTIVASITQFIANDFRDGKSVFHEMHRIKQDESTPSMINGKYYIPADNYNSLLRNYERNIRIFEQLSFIAWTISLLGLLFILCTILVLLKTKKISLFFGISSILISLYPIIPIIPISWSDDSITIGICSAIMMFFAFFTSSITKFAFSKDKLNHYVK